MKLLICILFITSSLQVHASAEIIAGLNSINNSANLNCSEMSQSDLALYCSHQVCGAPNKKMVKIGPQSASQYLSFEKNKEFKEMDKKLRNYFESSQREFTEFVDGIKKIKDPASLSTIATWSDEELTPFINELWLDIQLDFDTNLPPSQRVLKISSDPDISPNYLVHKEMIDSFNVTKDPFRSFKLGIINLEEFKTLISGLAQELETKLKAQNKNFSSSEFIFKINNRDQHDQSLTELYQSMIKRGQTEGVELIPRICKTQCQKAVSSLISQINVPKLEKKVESELNILSIDDRIAICKSDFVNTHLENTKKENFKKIWPEIKNGYKKKVLPKLSNHSAQFIAKYLDEDINFIFSNPVPANTYKSQEKLSKSNSPQLSEASLLARAYSIQNSGEKVFDSSMCSSSGSSTYLLWDMYVSQGFLTKAPRFRPQGIDPSRDNITVSPYSCEHAQEGKGIIAHEVGHAISNLMSLRTASSSSLRKYNKMRKCASAQWKNNPNAVIAYHKGDKFFTEEDTADVLSYMAFNDPTSPYGCALLIPDGSNYESLNLTPPAGDNHTPGMVRLLRELQFKAPHKIPETCKELIKRNSDKFGKKCSL